MFGTLQSPYDQLGCQWHTTATLTGTRPEHVKMSAPHSDKLGMTGAQALYWVIENHSDAHPLMDALYFRNFATGASVINKPYKDVSKRDVPNQLRAAGLDVFASGECSSEGFQAVLQNAPKTRWLGVLSLGGQGAAIQHIDEKNFVLMDPLSGLYGYHNAHMWWGGIVNLGHINCQKLKVGTQLPIGYTFAHCA